jgi:hypothetical protein
MFLATSNKLKPLLTLRYIGQVRADELERSEPDVRALVLELPRGFRLLVDLSLLETMDLNCLPVLGRMMELFDRSGVGLVVRVIPNPDKDIGFNILTLFHYPHQPQIITCETVVEAGRHLG